MYWLLVQPVNRRGAWRLFLELFTHREDNSRIEKKEFEYCAYANEIYTVWVLNSSVTVMEHYF